MEAMSDMRDGIHYNMITVFFNMYSFFVKHFGMLHCGCPMIHTSLLWTAPGACVRDLFGITVTSYPVWYYEWFLYTYNLFGITGSSLAKESPSRQLQ